MTASPTLGPVQGVPPAEGWGRIFPDQAAASGAVSCKAPDRPRTGPYLDDSATQHGGTPGRRLGEAVPGVAAPERSAEQALGARERP
jgi:hypothetical protein